MHVVGQVNARAVLFIGDGEPARADHHYHHLAAVQRALNLVAPIAGVQGVFVEEDLIGAKHLGEIVAQRDRPRLGIGLPITHKNTRHASLRVVIAVRHRRLAFEGVCPI